MNEGIRKKIVRDIQLLEQYLTENQVDMSEDEINEVLDGLDQLYELLRFFTT